MWHRDTDGQRENEREKKRKEEKEELYGQGQDLITTKENFHHYI